MRVAPGQTLRLTVYNGLPEWTPAGVRLANTSGRLRNTAQAYQVTGVHTHGLHVSPARGSDDVFRPIAPGRSRTYVYDLPANHGGGTFWVHPHWHSTESLQVGGGAAFPLVVEDPPGTLPRYIARMPELLWGLSALNVGRLAEIAAQASQNCQCVTGNCAACADRTRCNRTCAAQRVQFGDAGPGRAAGFTWNASSPVCPLNSAYCDGWAFDEAAGRETHASEPACRAHPHRARCQVGVGAGDGLYRGTDTAVRVLVNGELRPTVRIDADRWYRLRIIFAAVAHTLVLGMCSEAAPGRPAEPACVHGEASAPCEWYLLAKDGVYIHDAPRRIRGALLAPGNRADVLVRCPAGTHSLNSHPGPSALHGARAAVAQRLALVHAAERGHTRCALREFRAPRPCYLVDLRDRALAAAGMAPADLFREERNTSYEVTFEVHPFMSTPRGSHLAFEGPETVDLEIPGGRPVAMRLRGIAFHPSHQHINPVQVQRGLHDDGSALYALLEAYYRAGDWHDTVFSPLPGGAVEVRYQTDGFAGIVAHHCHILTHSDQGDWRNFRIVPNGAPSWAGARRVERTCLGPAGLASSEAVPVLGPVLRATGTVPCDAPPHTPGQVLLVASGLAAAALVPR